MIDLRSHIDQLNPVYAAGAAALAALVLILASTRFRASKSKPAMTLTVKWGREKLRVPLPAPDTKLGTLRALLAEQTALPSSSFKLVHAGAVMKDDAAPLSAFGLRSGSKIALIDGAANAHTSAPNNEKSESKPEPATEEGTITVIQDELARVQDRLVPALDVFLATISPAPPSSISSAPDTASATTPPSSTESASASAPAPQPTIPPPPPSSLLPDIEMEYRRLGEELLQALLRLDVLVFDGTWTSARTERKGAVKVVQSLLDRLDGGWRERKERLASQQVQ